MLTRINIITDGETTTVSLLKQLFSSFDSVDSVKVIYTSHLMYSDLDGSLNVFCRCSTPGLSWIAQLLKRNHIPYLFYIDDNLWELNDGSLLADYHSSPEVKKCLTSFVTNASLVITATPNLKDYIEDSIVIDTEVVALPNFVDMTVFERALLQYSTPPVHADKRKLRIGYAGSAKTEAFVPVLKALEKLRKLGYPFDFEVVGSKIESPVVGAHFGFEKEYDDYVKLVASRRWDIGLAPFLDDYFWSFKTDNKYREYSAFGIVGVFSNVEPYSSVVKNRENGFLANNTEESWGDAIRTVLDSRGDLAKIRSKAINDVKARYSLKNVSLVWETKIMNESFVARIPDGLNVFRLEWFLKNKLGLYYKVFLVKVFFKSLLKYGFSYTLRKSVNYILRRK